MNEQATNRDRVRPVEANRLTESGADQSVGHGLGAANQEASRLGQRYTVQEAAQVLGTTVDAVRGRIRRGTLDSLKADGVVYVLLDEASREHHADKSPPEKGDGRQPVGDEPQLVTTLQDQIEWLRREVERKDTIIMQMAQRIPELEAPDRPREAPVTPAEEPASTHAPPVPDRPGSDEPGKRSWWREFLGLE